MVTWLIDGSHTSVAARRAHLSVALNAIIGDPGMLHPGACKRAEVADRVASLTSGTIGDSICRYVIGRLGHRRYTLILGTGVNAMTGRTTADDAGMLHRGTAKSIEVTSRVAGLTRQTGWQVIASLGHGLHPNGECLAVVARSTPAHDTDMIHMP